MCRRCASERWLANWGTAKEGMTIRLHGKEIPKKTGLRPHFGFLPPLLAIWGIFALYAPAIAGVDQRAAAIPGEQEHRHGIRS
jgi:hypothetical protein